MCKKKLVYNTLFISPVMFEGPEDEDVAVLR